MSEKPTAEQWQAREAPLDDMAGGWHVLRGDPLTGVYADLFICRCDDKEDAELIAASPKMLSALRSVRTLFRPKDGLPADVEAHFRRMVQKDPVLAEVNDAIAKAKGG